MIKIRVRLENDYDIIYNDISITKEELKQFACNKARGMYTEGFYPYISADDNIDIEGVI